MIALDSTSMIIFAVAGFLIFRNQKDKQLGKLLFFGSGCWLIIVLGRTFSSFMHRAGYMLLMAGRTLLTITAVAGAILLILRSREK